jgi:hypothetical protein
VGESKEGSASFFEKKEAKKLRTLEERAGLIATILASSQPTYPLYVWLIAGEGVAKAAIVLCAVPLFAAVPWVARRSSLAGRLLLPLVGILNTVLAGWALGSRAGLEALLIPCAALAAVLLRRTERWAMLAVVALAILAWLAMDGFRPGDFTQAAAAGLRRMNAISAIALCGLIGWISPPPPAEPPPPPA